MKKQRFIYGNDHAEMFDLSKDDPLFTNNAVWINCSILPSTEVRNTAMLRSGMLPGRPGSISDLEMWGPQHCHVDLAPFQTSSFEVRNTTRLTSFFTNLRSLMLPGRSGIAPERSRTLPGRSGIAPVRSLTLPGRSRTLPGWHGSIRDVNIWGPEYCQADLAVFGTWRSLWIPQNYHGPQACATGSVIEI